jgi:hypothetical protein
VALLPSNKVLHRKSPIQFLVVTNERKCQRCWKTTGHFQPGVQLIIVGLGLRQCSIKSFLLDPCRFPSCPPACSNDRIVVQKFHRPCSPKLLPTTPTTSDDVSQPPQCHREHEISRPTRCLFAWTLPLSSQNSLRAARRLDGIAATAGDRHEAYRHIPDRRSCLACSNVTVTTRASYPL